MRYSLINENCAPKIGSEDAGGIDLRVNYDGEWIARPGAEYKVGLGIKLEVPKGWVALIFPRSGVGTKYGFTIKNTAGVIDSDYRGEVFLTFSVKEPLLVEPFERLVQCVVVPHYDYSQLEQVDELTDTARGAGGFGHSGKV